MKELREAIKEWWRSGSPIKVVLEEGEARLSKGELTVYTLIFVIFVRIFL